MLLPRKAETAAQQTSKSVVLTRSNV